MSEFDDFDMEDLIRQEEKAMELERDQAAAASKPSGFKVQNDAIQALLGSGPNGESEVVKVKPKRKAYKLTEEMLMNPTGFPLLLKRARVFKKRSTPEKTLDDFMSMIQIWGHELFPNYKFKDFLSTTEKLCSKQRLRIFREETLKEERRQRYGIYASRNLEDPEASAFLESLVSSTVPEATSFEPPLQPRIIPSPLISETVIEPVVQPVRVLSKEKLEAIERNRQAAMVKLAERQREREDKAREEEEAKVQAMIADAGGFFTD